MWGKGDLEAGRKGGEVRYWARCVRGVGGEQKRKEKRKKK